MPYLPSPPSIPLEFIEWEETGDDENPRNRLSAHIRIAGCDMHLEALEVTWSEQGWQSIDYLGRADIFSSLLDDNDVAEFQTITIGDREYVLYVTPFSA